jgi:hypothetical protein
VTNCYGAATDIRTPARLTDLRRRAAAANLFRPPFTILRSGHPRRCEMAASRGIRSQMTSSREAVAFRGTARMISSTSSPRRASICSLITSGRPESANRGTARTNVDGELRTSGSAVQFSRSRVFRRTEARGTAQSLSPKLSNSRYRGFMARDASSSTQNADRCSTTAELRERGRSGHCYGW